jgi:hypothetical protein
MKVQLNQNESHEIYIFFWLREYLHSGWRLGLGEGFFMFGCWEDCGTNVFIWVFSLDFS